MQLLHSATIDALAHDLFESAPPVIWFIRGRMRRHARNLAMLQLRALVVVASQPAASLSTIAGNLDMSMPTTSRLVAGLVDDRLLRRTACPHDRRKLALAITPAGRAVIARARRATEADLAHRLRRLSPARRRALSAALADLRSVFGTFTEGPSHPAPPSSAKA